MTKYMKTLLWRALYRSIVTVLSLVLLVTALSHLDTVKKWFHSAIAWTVATQTGWQLTEGQLALQWPLAITGHGVHLAGPDGSVRVDALYFKPSWKSFLGGPYALDALYLDGIHLTLPTAIQKTTPSLRESPPSSKAPWPYSLAIGDLRVSGLQWNGGAPPAWLPFLQGKTLEGSLSIDALSQQASTVFSFTAPDEGSSALALKWQNVGDDLLVEFTITEDQGAITRHLFPQPVGDKIWLEGYVRAPWTRWQSLLSGDIAAVDSDSLVGEARWQLHHPYTRLEGDLHLACDSHLRISARAASHPPIPTQLTATLTVELATGDVTAAWNLTGGDGAPLSVAAGSLAGTVTGGLDGDLTASGGGVTPWQGRCRLRYSDGVFAAEDLTVEAPDFIASGALAIETFAPLTLRGGLTADLLAPTLPWFPGLSGATFPASAHLALTLAADAAGRQGAHLNVAAARVLRDDWSGDDVTGDLTVADLTGTPQYDLRGHCSGLRWRDYPLCSCELQTHGGGGTPFPYNVTCHRSGITAGDLTSSGVWSYEGDTFTAVVDQVKGHLGTTAVTLLDSWQLTLAGDTVTATPLRCRIDGAGTAAPWLAAAPWLLTTRLSAGNGLRSLAAHITAASEHTNAPATELHLALTQNTRDLWHLDATASHPSGGPLALVHPYAADIAGSIHVDGAVDTALPLLTGHFTVDGSAASIPGSLSGDIRLDDSWQCRLTHCRATTLDAKVTGDLTVDIAHQHLEGALDCSLPLGGLPQSLSQSLGLSVDPHLTQNLYKKLASSLLGNTNDSLVTSLPVRWQLKIKGPWLAPHLRWKMASPFAAEGEGLLTPQGCYATASTALAGTDFMAQVDATTAGVTAKALAINSDLDLMAALNTDWKPGGAPATFDIDVTRTSGDVCGYVRGFWSLDGPHHLSVTAATATLSGHNLVLQKPSHLSWQDAQLHLAPLSLACDAGTVTLAADGGASGFHLHVGGDALPLETWLRPYPNLPLDGTIAFDGDFAGPWHSPSGDLHLDVRALTVIDPLFEKAPPCHLATNWHLTDSYSAVNGHLHCPGLEPIVFEAQLPMALSLFPWNFHLDTEAPLSANVRASGAIASLLDLCVVDASTVTGYLSSALNICGTLAAPSVHGLITLHSGSYEHPATGTVLKEIALRARAENSILQIEHLRGHDANGGTFTGQGSFRLDSAAAFPFSLECHLDKMALLNVDLGRASFSGDIAFTGDAYGATLSGRLDSSEASLLLPEELSTSDDVLDVVYVNVPAGTPPPLVSHTASPRSLYPIALDLTLSTASRLYIGARSLESAWRGQTHLTGSLPSPILHGELHIQGGLYRYGNKSFDLNHGSITFAGPFDKTSLYVIATLDTNDLLIEAILRGPLKNPSVALRSNPALPQQEIVSHLLFGKGLSEITPYQGNQLSQSISNLMVANNTPNLLDKVRNSLPIDFGIARSGDGNDVAVHVGSQLTRRVYVSLNRNLTDDSNSAALEAKIVNNVKLRAERVKNTRNSANDDAEVQFFLKWKHDF